MSDNTDTDRCIYTDIYKYQEDYLYNLYMNLEKIDKIIKNVNYLSLNNSNENKNSHRDILMLLDDIKMRNTNMIFRTEIHLNYQIENAKLWKRIYICSSFIILILIIFTLCVSKESYEI